MTGKHLQIYLLSTFCLLNARLALGQYASAEDGTAVEITGHYRYIYINKTTGTTNLYNFSAVTAFDNWSISVTNQYNTNDWGVMRYDGTNIYTLGSERGSENNTNKPYDCYGYAYQGEFFMPQGQDSVHLFFPWMCFHLTSKLTQPFRTSGNFELPPFFGARNSLLDYGYNWKIYFFNKDNSDFIQKFELVRDSSFDLKSEADELHRQPVDYPFGYSPTDHRLKMLSLRKDVFDGFIRARYECDDLITTNNWQIPSGGQFTLLWPDFKKYTSPGFIIFSLDMHVDRIDLLPEQQAQMVKIIAPTKTFVTDYRFRAANTRTKFNNAAYILQKSDLFPPDNDPKLLARAEDWLKQGPGYDDYRMRRKLILVGMFIVIALPGLIMLFRLRKTK